MVKNRFFRRCCGAPRGKKTRRRWRWFFSQERIMVLQFPSFSRGLWIFQGWTVDIVKYKWKSQLAPENQWLVPWNFLSVPVYFQGLDKFSETLPKHWDLRFFVSLKTKPLRIEWSSRLRGTSVSDMGSPTTLQDANPKGIGCLPGTIFEWLELLIFWNVPLWLMVRNLCSPGWYPAEYYLPHIG